MTTETETTETIQTTTETPPGAAPALTGKRANWTIAHAIKDNVITWQVKGAGALSLALSAVSEANRQRAALHGFVQRVSDAAAMARDSKTGASATPQQKFDAMKRLVDHYAGGAEDWSPARDTTGVGRPRTNASAELLKLALRIHAPEKSAETLEQFVKGLTGAQVTALLVSEQLKEAVELAREEQRESEAKMAEGVDAAALLSGL